MDCQVPVVGHSRDSAPRRTDDVTIITFVTISTIGAVKPVKLTRHGAAAEISAGRSGHDRLISNSREMQSS